MSEKFVPVDAEADARVQREIEAEEKTIKASCNELGVIMHEVGLELVVGSKSHANMF